MKLRPVAEIPYEWPDWSNMFNETVKLQNILNSDKMSQGKQNQSYWVRVIPLLSMKKPRQFLNKSLAVLN